MARKYTDKQIEKEADQIFMKMNPNFARRDGSFPAVSEMTSPAYNREYNRIHRQVRKVRR